VRLTITDREALRAADLGMLLATTLHRMHPQELNLDACLPLLGDRPTLEALRSGKSATAIPALWQVGLQVFEVRRRPYLLYERR
jgi:hypothetical protein